MTAEREYCPSGADPCWSCGLRTEMECDGCGCHLCENSACCYAVGVDETVCFTCWSEAGCP